MKSFSETSHADSETARTPEQFQRIEQLLGKSDAKKIRDSFVVILGLGAVGGYAMETLARSGVGRIRVVDHDLIRPSNLNRQILALHETLGQNKCEVARSRILAINPECKVEAFDSFVHKDTLDELLSGEPDVVIDAIDSMNPKLETVAALIERRQTAISCMGAALRTDPSRIRVGPLAEVTHCPLSAFLRKCLRRRGVEPTIPCVYSNEETRTLHRQAVFPPDSLETQEHQWEKGRIRTSLGSLASLTGIFGLTIAHWTLMTLCERNFNGSFWRN